MIKFVGLRAKTYSYLIDDDSEEGKKAKVTKKCPIKRECKFENYENCNEATLEKNKINVDGHKKGYEEFIRDNKLILKTQQRFKSEVHNVFIEEINRIVLNSNDDKKKQSIDSTETYGYGTSKDLVSEKEEIEWNNIIKPYKKLLILMMLLMKIKQNII